MFANDKPVQDRKKRIDKEDQHFPDVAEIEFQERPSADDEEPRKCINDKACPSSFQYKPESSRPVAAVIEGAADNETCGCVNQKESNRQGAGK